MSTQTEWAGPATIWHGLDGLDRTEAHVHYEVGDRGWQGRCAAHLPLGPAHLELPGLKPARILVHGAEVVDVTAYGHTWPEYVLGEALFTGCGEPPQLPAE